ncbi:hypothetical protein CHS0354_037147 [Potamilus streckersoni]|uniref:Uncharacterized protein n=1 Tax=Potamilus streckersoni TaxID=2493646 RepID=A0AAE0RPG0_9BIVA|nr:hypothetical protein CHS0354_037147 [Potamilus streckersoni]
MAGSCYGGKGSGANHDFGGNHLCLPEDPTWANYQDGLYSENGTEYEPLLVSAFTTSNREIIDRDAPCVACRTTRSSSIMITGRTYCYLRWTLEYSGYLVSQHYIHPAPTVTCV